MPTAPLTRCRHSARRQASAPQVTAWLSDFATFQSIDHHHGHRRSISFCRCISSHKSPLEAHRRLGKRHMAGIMASPPTYTPLWHFEIIGNPHEWQWQAPTTAEARQKKQNTFTFKDSMDKLVKWLEASDLDKPFLNPPTPTTVSNELITAVESEHIGLAQDIASLRTALCQLQNVTSDSVEQLSLRYRHSLSSKIASGNFTVDELLHAMNPLDSITREHISNDFMADELVMFVQKTVVSAIAKLRANDLADDYKEAWTAVAEKILSMDTRLLSLRSFRHLVITSTVADRRCIPADRIAEKFRQVIKTRGMTGSSAGGLARLQANSRVLKCLDDSQRELVVEKVDSWVRTVDAEHSYEHFSWVLVKAYFMPREKFENTLRQFQAETPTLKTDHIWQVCMARLLFDEYLDLDTHRRLANFKFKGPSERWNALTTTLVEANDKAGLWELYQICKVMGRSGKPARALIASAQRKNALKLIEQLIKDPHAPCIMLWDEINIKRMALAKLPEPENMFSSDAPDQMKSLTSLIDTIAGYYLTADQLSLRQAFRGVERSIKTSRYLTGRSSAATLEALSRVVTREMENGKWGRTTRLEYLMRILLQDQGSSEAKASMKVLRGWRKMIQAYKKNKYNPPTNKQSMI